jgi:hypothetical protein
MKPTVLVSLAAAAVCGCSVNGSGPVTSWGKHGITMLDYRSDAGQCAVIAATGHVDTDEANKSGINRANSSVPEQAREGGHSSAAGAVPSSESNPSSTANTIGGSTYRDSASPDFVNRAAMQQRSVEMAAQRARNDRLKFCLASRGYTEFTLTPEQRAALSQLPEGSDQRREYLYRLGTDPDVLARQSVPVKQSGS